LGPEKLEKHQKRRGDILVKSGNRKGILFPNKEFGAKE